MAQTAHPEEMEKTKTLSAGNKGLTPHKNHCAGFTLLELIIVIFIAGISVTIVAISIGRIYEKRVFNETSKKVFITLKHARETAILEKTPVAFKIDEETNSFWMEKNDTVYGKVQNMPERISIRGKAIIFFPKGNSSGGNIKIKYEKEREYSIEVDPVLGTAKIKGV